MFMETSRCVAAPEVWRVGSCGNAERLDFSDHLSADFAGDGFAVGLYPAIGINRSHSTAVRLHVHEFAASAFLLRAVFGG